MQHPDMPTLSASPYSAVSAAVSASAAASLLLGANPPDEVFLDRLAERFSQHPHIEVGGRPSSSATTTTTTTTSGAVGDDDDDNGDDRGRGDDDEDDKACIDDKQLHQHCFRFLFQTFQPLGPGLCDYNNRLIIITKRFYFVVCKSLVIGVLLI